MKINKKIINNLINIARKKNIYVVIRCQIKKVRYLDVKNCNIDRSTLNEICGTGIHAFTKSGHMGFASVDSISDKERLIKCLSSAISLAISTKKGKLETLKEIYKLKPTKGKTIQKVQIDPFKVPKKNIEKDLLNLNKKIKNKYKNASVTNTIQFHSDKWFIYRSDKTDIEFSVNNSTLSTILSINTEKLKNDLYEATSSLGYEVIKDKNIIKIFLKNLDKKFKYIKSNNKIKELKGGNYPILLDGEIGGVFIHEAFGHTAESDNFYSKSPLLSNGKLKKGNKIASNFINIFDYAEKNERAFQPYSLYGVKRKKAFIVKNGKINSLISDFITAKKTNSTLTGGERTGLYSNIPVPRMTNTKILLDKNHTLHPPFDTKISDVREIHKFLKAKNFFIKYPVIIYLVGSTGGSVDPYEGNFQFQSIASFKLTKDKVEILKPLVFSGITLKVIKSIKLALGEPIQWPGVCFKNNEWIIVNASAPMFLLEKNKFVTVV